MDWISLATAFGTGCLACFTGFLAVATVALAFEARKARIESSIRAQQSSLRGALTHIGLLITAHNSWNPILGSDPPEGWAQHRISLRAPLESLATAALPPALWRRLVSVATNIEAADNWLKGQLLLSNPEHAKRVFFTVDIYLKQLARYLTTEMKRQQLAGSEVDDLISAYPFAPAPWAYGDQAEAPEMSAQLMETQSFPPFTTPVPEPTDPAYRSAALSSLIADARTNIKSLFDLNGNRAI